MPIHFFLLFAIAFALSACNNKPKQTLLKGRGDIASEKIFSKDIHLPIDIPPPPAPYTGPKKYCFEMNLDADAKDVTRLHFILGENDSIHGRLDHIFSTRQPILGTVVGIKEGDIIELNYAYTDSGVSKAEELVLKLQEYQLFKKNGPMVLDERGVWVLENHRLSKYELFLEPRDCQ